jgi:hypothetical protein
MTSHDANEGDGHRQGNESSCSSGCVSHLQESAWI